MTTRASTDRPTKRIMTTLTGELIVEIASRTLTIRPLRSKAGGPAEVTVDIRGVYERALLRRVKPL